MRPRSSTGLGEKCLQAQKIWIKLRFTVLLKPAQCWRPLRNLQTKQNSWLTPEHQCTRWAKRFWAHKNWRHCGNPEPHNGGNYQWESANKRGSTGNCLRSWILRNSAITRRHGCTYVTWKALRRTRIHLSVGQRSKATPYQTRGEDSLQDGKFRTSCCPWIVVKFWYQFVLYIATAGLVKYIFKSSNRAKWRTGTRKLARFTNKPTQKKKGCQSSIGRPIARPSTMVRGVHSKSRRYRSSCKRTHFSGLWFGTAHKSGTQEAFTLTSRKTEIAKCACEPRWQRAPCRRRTGESVPRAEKFGDLITADHKVSKEEGESRNNHRYAVVVQDLATQWIQSHPCKTKTSQQTERSLRKFLVREAESRLHWQFFGFSANLEKIYHGIIEWYCWKTGTQRKRRNVCCIVAIGLGWIMVGWGMLLPSATCPRPPGRWENSFWKTFWRTTSRPSDSFLGQWLNIIRFLHESSQGSANLPRKFYLEHSSDMHLSRGIRKGDTLVADIEELENMDASENPCKKTQCKGSVDATKEQSLTFPVADGKAKMYALECSKT